jgi:acyl-CoA hydrolase/RimJ/RimL family protein N-acetyltransferase
LSDSRRGLGRLEKKLVSADDAVAIVKPGNHVYVGTACATPLSLIAALERRRPTPADVELYYFLTSGLSGLWAETPSRFSHRCFFVGTDARALVRDGRAEYVPISLAHVPELIANGRLQADVAFLQVSPPDDKGYVSLGISVDIGMAVAKHAKSIVVEVNPAMPRTRGDTQLHVDRITHAVLVDTPLTEYVHEPADEVAERIARYVSEIIDDGATLQVDLGRIPNETLKFLRHRRDLGIHSNVITEGLVDLIEAGVVTGRRKTLHPGKIVTSFCIGTERLYRLVDDNSLFEFYPIEYVADPAIVARNDKMVSLTQGFAIDLTGQVCADQFHGEFYSGVSTQIDFHRGAARSAGGKPIVCLRSTTENGLESRIRPTLLAGEGVTLVRSNIHYVVTEFGIAYLFGKSVRERAIALIAIAHPDFREGLLAEAQALHLIPAAHRLGSRREYLVDEERNATLKSGETVRLRPAGGGDVAAMRSLFHRMSSEDVYMRFFRKVSALSYDEAQRLCNVDFDQDVAFVAVKGPRENEEIIGIAGYFLNPSTNLAEIAFMVEPVHQKSGLGTAMQDRLSEFARARKVRGFVAEVLQVNEGMMGLARRLGEVDIHTQDGVHTVTCIFGDPAPPTPTPKAAPAKAKAKSKPPAKKKR